MWNQNRMNERNEKDKRENSWENRINNNTYTYTRAQSTLSTLTRRTLTRYEITYSQSVAGAHLAL